MRRAPPRAPAVGAAAAPLLVLPRRPFHPHLVCRQADDRHHARGLRVRGRLHALPAQLHQPQAVVKADGAGVGERRVLAQGQAAADVGGGRRLLPLLCPQLLQRRQAGHVDGGLADGGGVQLVLGACGGGGGGWVGGMRGVLGEVMGGVCVLHGSLRSQSVTRVMEGGRGDGGVRSSSD